MRRAIATASRLLRSEVVEWFRAVLRAIPGEIGCCARRTCYGFRCGAKTRVLTGVIIYYPESLVMGRSVGIAAHCQLNAGGGIEIGDAVLIGPGCLIWSQNHRYQDQDREIIHQGYERDRIRIEDDVWVGAGAIILPGVCLARGTVVAAGSVVTRSTEAYTVVAGTPARALGRRVSGGRRDDCLNEGESIAV